jgi:inner membrane protein
MASFVAGKTFLRWPTNTFFCFLQWLLLSPTPPWGLPSANSCSPSASTGLGVPYASLWGHRGLTHSLLAAAIVAAIGTLLAQLARPARRPATARLALLLFLATASHGVLDALTTGGLGVAFFSPWHLERYFFPLRPIKVSPLSIRAFFGGKGLRVLASEVVWVGLPCLLLLLGQRWWQSAKLKSA